jgi:hypothetical protein
MDSRDLPGMYQWNYRPQSPRRPTWFTQWPGGNRIAVTFNIMHEWESTPRSNTIRKRTMSEQQIASIFSPSARESTAPTSVFVDCSPC